MVEPVPDALEVTLQGRGKLELSLIEKDGTAWSASAAAGTQWSTVKIPLSALRLSRSIHIPSPYPGLWNYWRVGRQQGALRVGDVERVQLTVYAGDDVAVEAIRLIF